MGNLHYLTTRRHVRNIEWESLLDELNRDLFGGIYTFKVEREPYLLIEVWREGQDWPAWRWTEESQRKLACNYPSSRCWVNWSWTLMHHTLAQRLGGHFQEYGEDITYPDPGAWDTFDKWWDAMTHHRNVVTSPAYLTFQAQWKIEKVTEIPDKLRPYAGVCDD